MPAPGSKIGPYEVVESIGRGNTKLGRDVAVKILPRELASDPARLRRFEQEARAASALNHPNIDDLRDR